MIQSTIRLVDLRRQYESIESEIDSALKDVVSRGAFILGPAVEDFERAFAAYCGARYCVGVGSGTDALSIALASAKIGPGDEVILPDNTFIATAFAVSHVGATPVLVDVDEQSLLITSAIMEKAITRRTKAVIPVHLFGSPVDMNPILDLARHHGIVVIEDACQAHGARYGDKRVGNLGAAAAFSFYPGKNLGAYGDGGAVVTNDEQIALSARLLRDLGQRKKYDHAIRGFNSRLDSVQAAILNVKVRYLESWNEARQQRAAWYDEVFRLAGLDGALLEQGHSVYHLYPVRLERRDLVMASLREHDIEFGIHYPTPIHLQEAYSYLGHAVADFPISERWSECALSLPMFPELRRDELERVVDIVAHVEKSSVTAASERRA